MQMVRVQRRSRLKPGALSPDRCCGQIKVLKELQEKRAAESSTSFKQANYIEFSGVDIETPTKNRLVDNLSFRLGIGDSLLLTGHNVSHNDIAGPCCCILPMSAMSFRTGGWKEQHLPLPRRPVDHPQGQHHQARLRGGTQRRRLLLAALLPPLT